MISKEEAIILLKANNCSEKLVRHCINVSNYAITIGKKASNDFKIDIKLIEIGGLLHDIGRSRTNNIDHGILGAKTIRDLELDEKLALICERHIGAGIEKKEADRLGLPSRNYLPETIEEKIICHADNFFINSNKATFESVLNRFILELGENHCSIKRLLDLQKELQKYL